MRIVQLVDSLDYGGAEQVAASLAIALRNREHDVQIVCLRRVGEQPVALPELRSAGVPVVPLNKPEGFHLRTLRLLAGWLKANRVEVLHSHNPQVHHYAVAAGRMAGVPAILNTLHGTATLSLPRWAASLYWCSCLLGDRVVSVCPEVQSVFRRRFRLPAGKCAVVDNGVDLSPFLAVARQPRTGPLILGTAGRLAPVKNHRLLIEAFALIRRSFPEVRLRILGDGPAESELRQLVNHQGLSDAVEFWGYRADVAGFLAGLSVYVLSSSSEGLPMSLLEAIASGLTVVATEVGGVPGIIQRTGAGWLCPPSDVSGMSDNLAAAIQCSDREARGDRARKIAAQWYSVWRMASGYERLYRAILNGRRT